jgi:hypothetical protein
VGCHDVRPRRVHGPPTMPTGRWPRRSPRSATMTGAGSTGRDTDPHRRAHPETAGGLRKAQGHRHRGRAGRGLTAGSGGRGEATAVR